MNTGETLYVTEWNHAPHYVAILSHEYNGEWARCPHRHRSLSAAKECARKAIVGFNNTGKVEFK